MPPQKDAAPFEIIRDEEQLTLRLPAAPQLTAAGCGSFAVTAIGLLVIGLFSLLHDLRGEALRPVGEPFDHFTPTENHFGFLWLVTSILMLVAVPIYVVRSARAPLVFRFLRTPDLFLRNNRQVTRLARVEGVCLRETQDPDQRFLYLLHVVYADGREIEIFNGYDERAMMNLANEIARFTHARVFWKTGEPEASSPAGFGS